MELIGSMFDYPPFMLVACIAFCGLMAIVISEITD